MATETFQQMSIEFSDSCPYCDGRGVIPKVMLLRGSTMRVVETVYSCLLCKGKGILEPETLHDFLWRKLAINAHLYNKVRIEDKQVLNKVFGRFVPRP